MKIRGFITHKCAEYYSDCADYFSIDAKTKKIAVSDGISQSIMPLEWAKILSCQFTSGIWIPSDNIAPLQKIWQNEAHQFLEEQKKDADVYPWILENCLEANEGAGATFCGITFEGFNWDAAILGDSCLVSVKKKNGCFYIEQIYSSKEKNHFDNNPDYFDSFNNTIGNLNIRKGQLGKNNVLMIVTDPFSELFERIKNTAEEDSIIRKILAVQNQDEYCALVDELRNQHQMHDDDSTLIIIEYDKNVNFSVKYEMTLEDAIKNEKNTLSAESHSLSIPESFKNNNEITQDTMANRTIAEDSTNNNLTNQTKKAIPMAVIRDFKDNAYKLFKDLVLPDKKKWKIIRPNEEQQESKLKNQFNIFWSKVINELEKHGQNTNV